MNEQTFGGWAVVAAPAGAAWLLTLTPTALPGKLYNNETIGITP